MEAIVYNDELYHYGKLGMKWGHRKNVTPSKISNIDKWGSDKNHNILYITGYSGSGKSTLASKFKNEKTNVIHLDPYFEKMDKNIASNIQDKEFNEHLKKNFPNYKSIANPKNGERHSKDWWNKVDLLMEQTEKFAEQQFPKKKVIIEGVQLSDNTTYPDKNFFKDKPIAITNTGAIKSLTRAYKRDNKSISTIIKEARIYTQWYGNMHESLDKLTQTTNAKNGKDWVENYIKQQSIN